jgi:hypothetical protein
MSIKRINEQRVTTRTHWAWLFPILALSPLSLAAKGCDNTGVIGDNCPTPEDCPSGTAGTGGSTPPATCGGLLGKECSDRQYCDYPARAACGAGDQTGVCKPRPTACDLSYSPVCGCDDRTYGNDCAAQSAGVSIAHSGECESSGGTGGTASGGTGGTPNGGAGGGNGKTCGGIAALRCDEGLYCNFPVETQCGSGDRTGTCAKPPEGCTKELNQVCGCDEVTYGNPCMAAAAGVSIAHQGACRTKGAECGEIGGCEPDEFCNFPPSSRCGLADGPGVCTKRPPKGTPCDAVYAPVCGCDGETYGNECEALIAAASVATEGECGALPGGECGGLLPQECKAGFYCDYPPNLACGAGDQLGVCKLKPEACDAVYAPVCGCDGKTYGNTCEAASAGVAVASDGACKK